MGNVTSVEIDVSGEKDSLLFRVHRTTVDFVSKARQSRPVAYEKVRAIYLQQFFSF
jgi:hypothetical protein